MVTLRIDRPSELAGVGYCTACATRLLIPLGCQMDNFLSAGNLIGIGVLSTMYLDNVDSQHRAFPGVICDQAALRDVDIAVVTSEELAGATDWLHHSRG